MAWPASSSAENKIVLSSTLTGLEIDAEAKKLRKDRNVEKSVQTLITNAVNGKQFKDKGNPGVFETLQPIHEQAYLDDMNAMGVLLPSTAKTANKEQPAIDAPRPKPTKRKADIIESKPATRSSKRIAVATRNRKSPSSSSTSATSTEDEDEDTSDDDHADDKDDDDEEDDDDAANNGGDAGNTTEDDESSDTPSESASGDNTQQQPASPAASLAPSTSGQIRTRNDPVVGDNGFRLLHPQHHFAPGRDQSAHLTLRYTDDTLPGVEQTISYNSRGANKGAEIDWRSAKDMARLNRWLNQVLKRHGAASLRADVVWFTEAERAWLRGLGRRVERERKDVWTKERMTDEFNARWAGTVIEEAGRFYGRERPVRSKDALQSEIYRNSLFPKSLKKKTLV